MGAADKTFEILVKTTADRTGAQQTQADLDRLKQNGGSSGDILATEKEITSEVEAQGAATQAAAVASELNGINIEKASAAAGKLAENVVLGRDVSRSLSAVLIEFAPLLAPAAAGAVGLYEAMKGTLAVAQTLGTVFGGFSIQDLVSGFNPEALLKEIANAHELQRAIAEIDKQSLTQLSINLEKSNQKIVQLTDSYRIALVANSGLLEPITQKNEKIRLSIESQIKAEEENNRLLLIAQNVAHGLLGIEQLRTAELARQEAVLRTQIEAQRQGTQLNKEFLDARAATLTDADRLTDFQTRIDSIKSHLQAMGIAAASPNEAFQKSIGLADSARNQVVQLATEWLKLSGNVKSAQDEIAKFEQQRAAARNALITAAEATDITQAATALAELNKQGKELLGLKTSGPDAALEKLLLDTISNASASTAQVNQFREALRQLYAQQAAAPKAPPVSPTQNNDAPLPRIVDIKPPPQPIPPASTLAAGAAAGAGADQAAIKIEEGIRAGIENQSKQIGEILQQALGADGVFDPLSQAVQAGTAAMATAVISAVGNLKTSFDRETKDLQSQIDQLWQVQG